MGVNKGIHYIGLGGAGCHAIEYIHKKGVKAKFIGISYPVRLHLPADIQFISYVRVSKSQKFDGRELIKDNFRYVLLAGLGGNTGTCLVEELTHLLMSRNKEFQAICSLPFTFEGEQRRMLAQRVKTKFQSSGNFICFDLNLIRKNWDDMTLSRAFEKADEQFFWLSQVQNFN